MGAPLVLTARRALSIALVVTATVAGGYGALATFAETKHLSVGQVRLSVSPGHRGALDLYVPLVDWGARFEAMDFPARLRVDLRTVDRDAARRVAQGTRIDVRQVREEARDAIAAYLRALIAVVALTGLALGLLVALAIRSRTGPRLRWTTAAVTGTVAVMTAVLALTFPPRGEIADPQYYAYGADIPGALAAVDAAQRSPDVLDQELDVQLVGLARLVVAPGNRRPLAGQPHVSIASDLHNNILAVPMLERTAADGPLLFAGDLTDRGSPIETRLMRRVLRTGKPFVFVSGNHDSDALLIDLARAGAIVMTTRGRLNPDGSVGAPTVTVGGLRIAAYSDPFERRAADDFRDRYQRDTPPEELEAFATWLDAAKRDADVIMVHNPSLIPDPPPAVDHPLVFVTGHTHEPHLQRPAPDVTVINGGTSGAGGTGGLGDRQPFGIARLIYARRPFEPLAADLISIAPETGDATARRERLDDQSG